MSTRTIRPAMPVVGREFRFCGGEYTDRDPREPAFMRKAKPEPKQGKLCLECFTLASTSGKCDCYADGERHAVKPVDTSRRAAVKAPPRKTSDPGVVKVLRKAYDLTRAQADLVAGIIGDVDLAVPEFAEIVTVIVHNVVSGDTDAIPRSELV